MLQEERKNYVLTRLETQPSITVKELSDTFQMSEVTVRKILVQMEKEGLLKRSWGGAVRITNAAYEAPYSDKESRCLEEKRAIAKAAYDSIKDGETIYIDCGTTSFELIRLVVAGKKRLHVCTNAFNNLAELRKAPGIQAIMIGGELRPAIYSCVGPLAIQMLKMLVFDRAFVTGDHFSLEHGFSVSRLSDAEVKAAVFAAAKRKYIIMDSTKYGDDSMSIIATPSDGYTLITDWQLPEEVCHGFEKRGTRVVLAQAVE
ncbi:MAG: DeoR/GlpR family DNA-binding transcription regulator [Eubacteriales bacterium]|nr:DeoR/GlpR family DNA-binding transcription regulator [Eubacteriales bacterium]